MKISIQLSIECNFPQKVAIAIGMLVAYTMAQLLRHLFS
jgi:hypothetical protein